MRQMVQWVHTFKIYTKNTRSRIDGTNFNINEAGETKSKQQYCLVSSTSSKHNNPLGVFNTAPVKCFCTCVALTFEICPNVFF